MSIAKHSGGIFKYMTCTKRKKSMYSMYMVVVLQNNCTTTNNENTFDCFNLNHEFYI